MEAEKLNRFLHYLKPVTEMKLKVKARIGENHSFSPQFFEGNLLHSTEQMADKNTLIGLYNEALGRRGNKKIMVLQQDLVKMFVDVKETNGLMIIEDLMWHDEENLVEFWGKTSPEKG